MKYMKKNRSFVLSFVVLAVSALLSAGLYLNPAVAGPLLDRTEIPTQMSDTTLAVVPSKTQVNPGDVFDLNITIQTNAQTRATQFDITFDPKLVEFTSDFQEGDFYKSWAADRGATTVVIPQPVPDNTAGKVKLTGIAILGAAAGTGGPTGKGTLMTLHVKAKAVGVVVFRLGNVIVADAGDVQGTTSALAGVKVQDGSVGIGSGETASTSVAREATPSGPQAAPTITPEPTIEKRTTLNGDQSGPSSSLPLEIILPVAGAVVLGIGAFFFLRKR